MSLRDMLDEEQRLAILLSLGEAEGYRLNESILKSMLTSMALVVGQDDVRVLLTWLERYRLVRLEKLPTQTSGELWIAFLTTLGDDVRQGRSHLGVKRPGPR
jgi:hypothetical protein